MYDIITIKKIIAGSGAIDALGREVKNLQVEKVLIVTDKGVVNAGIVDKALKPLKRKELNLRYLMKLNQIQQTLLWIEVGSTFAR